MPRSKPQNTRRKLESAMNHIDKAIKHIYDVLPFGVDIKDWDERYVKLVQMNTRLIGVYDCIFSMLFPEGEEKDEKQDDN